MPGQLLTQDFLYEGIKRTTAYRELDPEWRSECLKTIRGRLEQLLAHSNPNEAVTEADLIYPVLEALGWESPLVQQQTGKRRINVPDALLFHDASDRKTAAGEDPQHRFRHGTTFVEAKRWDRALDRGDKTDRTDPGVPSNQMLRYLSQVEIASDGQILWGILTNGRHWRLYHQRSTNRAEEFLEFDLPVLFGLIEPDNGEAREDEETREHLLSCFLLFFRPDSFLPDSAINGRSFLEYARNEARLWEEKVAEDLSEVVFQDVFPRLIRGFVSRDPERPETLDEAYLTEIRDAALVFLYRLLFILYAEDRNLLPVRDKRYDDYSLRKPRRDIADRVDANDTFSTTQTRYYDEVKGLFQALAAGDNSIGLPPYNGGLFNPQKHPTLERLSLADDDFAAVLDGIARREDDDRRLWINFRDLSVQQLGSIYERLLEFRAVSPDGKKVEIEQGTYSRRSSGSYYTHEDLVQLILERTLGPLIEERREVFLANVEELTSDNRTYAVRLKELEAHDPASRLLELKVVDPAMGSGHFLVSAIDYLADRTLELVSEAEQAVEEAGWKQPYASPLQDRLAAIRETILEQATEHDWPVEEAQLDDRHLVRRILLKRVIYGVDLNPMAVELAKLALWLHSFTVGAPLSFLDHHLRCGNSLIGADVEKVRNSVERSGLWGSSWAHMLYATDMMQELQTLTDADLAEVKESADKFEQIENTLDPYRRLMALDTSTEWNGTPKNALSGRDVLGGEFGEPLELVKDPAQVENVNVREVIKRALDTAEWLRLFPWQLMFPEVWYEKARVKADGGFDAVIGNPPWDRIKLQQVEFFAERRSEIANAQTAAERKRMIKALKEAGDPLWDEYEEADGYAKQFATYARESEHFPLLAKGDINLYALFVERAFDLIHDRGLVGLLVPSGIAADYYKGEFFGSLATAGRLVALLDFENKKVFFPDIHASFKFSVFVGSGPNRTFDETDCAFFLHSISELENPERSFPLAPTDFASVNPNTRTAPVFRTARDADLTTAIYKRLPVLVDESGDEELNPWGIDYTRMFDMTNDSNLFRTADQLEEDGFYRVDRNNWKKGDELYVPLYEGKMVQLYDHRAASIEVDTSRTHRPAQPVTASEEQHKDANWYPQPQYWVPEQEVKKARTDKWPEETQWYLGFKEITSPTNQRTMISAMVPFCGAGNSLPLLPGPDAKHSAELLSVFNSFVFDFVARQKVQGNHLNLYILEQLPVPPPEAFEAEIGDTTIGELVEDGVLRLTYTAHDMAPFARELGHDLPAPSEAPARAQHAGGRQAGGEPFPWDEDERRHLMARLDAMMFRLFGITDEDDIRYILSTFPIIQRQDEEQFGAYRTRELILGYFRAQSAGDLVSEISA